MAVVQQLSLLGDQVSVTEAALDPGADYGEVFTRRWVVEFILDLVGYTPERDLGGLVIVEPSCGTGAFLGPIVDRLIASARGHHRPLASLGSAIRAYDLLDANAKLARKAVMLKLQDAGLDTGAADVLAGRWVTTGDFLLQIHEPGSAHVIVGNPPYIRLESVPEERMRAYRSACPTMRGRADIYVGFYEMGLSLLAPSGVLGFICADRWMRNQYGADLRALVTSRHAVDTVVTMHDVDAFEDDVSAYPAVVVLRNGDQARASVVGTTGSFGETEAVQVARWVRRGRRNAVMHEAYEARRVEGWFSGRDLWPTGSPAQLALIADLEARFPPLQDAATGTRVGIGVATGCDDVFITSDSELVEEDRLLPLLRASDITTGSPDWAGGYLVNPWNGAGLVDLARYPRLARYLAKHRTRLQTRHIAQKRPIAWYRTIDRVDHGLTRRPKLVLPDMKAAAHPVLDEGEYYPHHNLYFVVSDKWDPEVLGGILLSDLANLFVGAYCVRMRGGCYRFQAQYLRRVRVPEVGSVANRHKQALAKAFRSRDVAAATAVALHLYGIDDLPGLG